jgi:hypothetical protein
MEGYSLEKRISHYSDPCPPAKVRPGRAGFAPGRKNMARDGSSPTTAELRPDRAYQVFIVELSALALSCMPFRGKRNGMRKVVLAAAVLVHAVLLLTWRPAMVAQPADGGRETYVYLLAAPPKPAPAPGIGPTIAPRIAQQDRAPVRQPRPATQAAAAAPLPAQAPSAAEAITLEQVPDAVAKAAEAPGASLVESSRKLAGSVDQQLRKEKAARELVAKPEIDLTERFKEVYNDYSEVPSHVATVTGDRLDRVEGPHGTYCVRTTGNGPGAGRDPFKDAGKQVVVNCPQRGPLSDDFIRRKKKRGQ